MTATERDGRSGAGGAAGGNWRLAGRAAPALAAALAVLLALAAPLPAGPAPDGPRPASAAAATATPPANDDFDAATVVDLPADGTPWRQVGLDTSGATVADDDPSMASPTDLMASCGDYGPPEGPHFVNHETLWYRLTPTFSGEVGANTLGSDYDTVLAVFTGSRGALSFLTCGDETDDPPTSQSAVTFRVTAGTTYHLEVARYLPPAGSLALTVRRNVAWVYLPALWR